MTPGSSKSKRAPWNGKDWYVSFGGSLDRRWEDAHEHGFVSAGGGRFYTQSMRSLPEGARIWVNLPGTGYVAVGTTLGPARRFAEAMILKQGEWSRLAEQPLAGLYERSELESDDDAEWVVPVRWLKARPESQAFWVKGMFGNQHSACKLRQEFTLERLAEHFDLESDSE